MTLDRSDKLFEKFVFVFVLCKLISTHRFLKVLLLFEESDLIQHAGKAFGERLIADRFALTLDTCDKDLKPILAKVYNLYLATIVEKNLAWFVISGT